MLTRRTAIASGLAFASMAGAAWPRQRPSVDALLIDDSIEKPRHLAEFLKAGRWELPVLEVRLDAPGQAGLQRVLDQSQVIAGISCGATLFCLERIGWDHGFRLTGRRQRGAAEPGAAYWHDVTAFLNGHPPAAGLSSPGRPYRPSRADGLLHTWVIAKPRADARA